jgi:DNA-binding SARP family transcriptional activator
VAEFEFRILGPLEAIRGGDKVELGGRRQRRLLAALLLEPGERVSVDRLVESIWDHEPPPSARHLVQVYISQLRSLLDPSLLRTRAGGYTLDIDPVNIDAFAFERCMRGAAAAHSQGRLAEALELYEEALGLWRGAVLEDVDPPPALRPAVEELEEKRLLGREQRAEAMLELGRHHELVAELERLVSKEPLRERLRGQLMLALYRSGRQADALEVYRDGRKYLSQQLGMEPAPELRRLERAILAHDHSLAPPFDSSEQVVSAKRPRTARREVRMLLALATVLALVAGGAITAVVV